MIGLAVAILLVPQEPMLKNLGGFHRKVETDSTLAQRLVDEGIVFYYSYHYDQARQAFEAATKADHECAMAHWGVAATHGPNINNPGVNSGSAKLALEALDKARNSKHSSPLEQKLVEAEALRFEDPAPTNRTDLNHAYTEAMKKIWDENSGDPDIGALYAEAIMDERPWNQWQPNGTPNPGTLEAISVLEAVLKLNPKHPMGLHLMIHATEASSTPEKGIFAADRLLNLLPEVAHMQHMPCHTYARAGVWDKAILANQYAIALSTASLKARHLDPRRHPNVDHYGSALAYAAGMRGQSKLALSAIDIEGFTTEQLQENFADYDGDLAMPLMVEQQFGKWDKILATPEFGLKLPISEVMRLGARAVAYAAKDDLVHARREQFAMENVLRSIHDDKEDGFDKAVDVLAVEKHLTAGEILIRDEGKEEEAIKELRAAVAAEDKLHYAEPPTWIMPTRHALGAALLRIGKYPEAEKVFLENLVKNPNDGWATMGLYKAYKGQNKTKEAEVELKKFKILWKDADVEITTSCMCLEPVKKGG